MTKICDSSAYSYALAEVATRGLFKTAERALCQGV